MTTNTPTQVPHSNYWLPFTPNRYFAQHPKKMASAKGAYYTDAHGRKLFDCISGLWCCPLGHGEPRLIEALVKQAQQMDYHAAFQLANDTTMSLAERIAAMTPGDLNRVFFCNSGSEAADTAIKIAIAFHRAQGNASRTRIIGRERGYHGVGIGGMSVGGMVANRKQFASLMMPGVDHLPHTHNLSQMAFSRGQPTWGAHLADELERLVALHDASTIAAVIVEPMAGSTGVLVPPVGYLQKLREICTRHGILLIFDEVITGFGRMGAAFAAEHYGVTPDIMTCAKGINNGMVPLGATIASDAIYDAIIGGAAPAHAIEFFHGYTYSGHPLATAVAHAAFDIYAQENLFARVRELEVVLEASVHAIKNQAECSAILDIRNAGLAAAIELKPRANAPGQRGMAIFERAMEKGMLIRITGDTIALGPPFISTKEEIERMCSVIAEVIYEVN